MNILKGTPVKNRARNDIIAMILEAAQGRGTSKTKIMFKAYLSTNQLREYLSELLDNGLVKYDEDRKTYQITHKGERYLELYSGMERMIPMDNLKIEE
ncbi:MAG TPA: winged helix-turn-helix domain-containing protein [Nitrososphaeraceae archaeon]|nr:winged helix-turn-helix domain-containing protein [Nitrososphaeraceae archaeon]